MKTWTKERAMAHLGLQEVGPCDEPMGEPGDMELLDKNGTSHFGVVDYIGIERLGFCGCGDMESALKLAATFLPLIATHTQDGEWGDLFAVKYPSEVAYFVLYALDRAKLTEHGGSVGGCWFTDDGWACYTLLKDSRPAWFASAPKGGA